MTSEKLKPEKMLEIRGSIKCEGDSPHNRFWVKDTNPYYEFYKHNEEFNSENLQYRGWVSGKG